MDDLDIFSGICIGFIPDLVPIRSFPCCQLPQIQNQYKIIVDTICLFIAIITNLYHFAYLNGNFGDNYHHEGRNIRERPKSQTSCSDTQNSAHT